MKYSGIKRAILITMCTVWSAFIILCLTETHFDLLPFATFTPVLLILLFISYIAVNEKSKEK